MNDNPIMKTINNLFALAKGLLFLVGIFLLFWSIPYYIKHRKKAKSSLERHYWTYNLISSCLMAYAIFLFLLLAIDGMFLHLGIEDWWPTISWILCGPVSHSTSVCLDIFWLGCIGGVMLFTNGIFGSSDNFGRYTMPEWASKPIRAKELEARIAEHQANPPQTEPGYDKLSRDEQRSKDRDWELGLQHLRDALNYNNR